MVQPWGWVSKPRQPCWILQGAWITSLAWTEQGWLNEARCGPQNQLWELIGSFTSTEEEAGWRVCHSLLRKLCLRTKQITLSIHSREGKPGPLREATWQPGLTTLLLAHITCVFIYLSRCHGHKCHLCVSGWLRHQDTLCKDHPQGPPHAGMDAAVILCHFKFSEPGIPGIFCW